MPSNQQLFRGEALELHSPRRIDTCGRRQVRFRRFRGASGIRQRGRQAFGPLDMLLGFRRELQRQFPR